MDNKKGFSDAQKQEIVSRLTSRIPNLHCPMCGKNQFTAMEGYFRPILQPDLANIQLGGLNMPTVAIVCNNCGFVSYHALGSLGLLPKDNPDNNESENEKEK